MPRTSAAALAILQTQQRAAPPKNLTKDQAAYWSAIVNRMPADWFPAETYGLLAQYCRHCVNADYLGAETPANRKDKLNIMKLQAEETRSMVLLASKMRITQQSTMGQWRSKKLDKVDNVTNLPWKDEE